MTPQLHNRFLEEMVGRLKGSICPCRDLLGQIANVSHMDLSSGACTESAEVLMGGHNSRPMGSGNYLPACGVHIYTGQQSLQFVLHQWAALLLHGFLQFICSDCPAAVGIHCLKHLPLVTGHYLAITSIIPCFLMIALLLPA